MHYQLCSLGKCYIFGQTVYVTSWMLFLLGGREELEKLGSMPNYNPVIYPSVNVLCCGERITKLTEASVYHYIFLK